MRVLVTGSSGFIGSHLVRWLQGSGDSVIGLSHRDCDLCRSQELERVFSTLEQVDVVVHAAAEVMRRDGSSSARSYGDNVQSTENLVKTCVQRGLRRFIFLSSSSVYGAGYFIQRGQERLSAPSNDYAQSKLASEQVVMGLSGGMSSVVLRLPTVIGPGKRSADLISEMIGSLRKGEPIQIYGKGDATRQLVDVRDLCELIHQLIGFPEIYPVPIIPVVNLELYRIREIAEQVIAIVGHGRMEFLSRAPEPQGQFIEPLIFQRIFREISPVSDFSFQYALKDSIRAILGESKEPEQGER